MALKACTFYGDGTIECGGDGSHCRAAAVVDFAKEDLDKFNHFIHTSMTMEERKNVHDDILVKLTDDVNRLIHESEKKRPDKRIGILITPGGLFFRYNSHTAPPTDKQGIKVTDENVARLLKLPEDDE
ncbi:hypothetical protein [Candidatus Nitrosocosmicus sp. R]|jgi:hypothetical protein